MRIDASNLLLAAQVQTRPSAAGKAVLAAPFESATFETKPAATDGKSASQAGINRLGQRLDIKI